MATIVKEVEPYLHGEVHEGVECNNCGCGKWNDTTPLQLCRCGKMMESKTFDFSKWIPGYIVIRCESKACNKTVDCRSFTNTCSCGRDYNFSGTLLEPREHWVN